MRKHRRLLIVLLWLAIVAGSGCGSDSPTAPSPPASDLAAQVDALWSTFDREYSYFVHKRIDWSALRSAYRPRAIEAADQTGFIAVIRDAWSPSRSARSPRPQWPIATSRAIRELGPIGVAALLAPLDAGPE
jgi:hypothetical protein